jgi:hypothetical protein
LRVPAVGVDLGLGGRARLIRIIHVTTHLSIPVYG